MRRIKTAEKMEELDYHVTFPTKFSNGDGAAVAEGGNASSRARGKKEPVIFLLGWYGCQDKHLAKYSAIYQSEGYITIRYTLPHDYIFSSKRSRVKDVALKVLESFYDLGVEDNPIFFHVFSNGGGYIYRHITEILNGPTPGQYGALKIAGLLMDSMPSSPTASKSFVVIYMVMSKRQHWLIAYIKSYLVWIYLKVIGILRLWFNLGDVDRDRRTYYDAMLGDAMPCPQLFLYSKADKLVAFEEVRAVMAERRRRGFDAREVVWEDSEHVAHLQRHTAEYVASCKQFVTDCLDIIHREKS